jgi:hypothetical protein
MLKNRLKKAKPGGRMVGFEDDDEEISLPDEQRRGDRDDRDVDSKMQEL